MLLNIQGKATWYIDCSVQGKHMRIEDYPNLMVVKSLTYPVDLSVNRLKEISSHVSDAKAEVIVHGLFVMAVASMEVMIADVLNYFLRSFPQKLPANEFKFEKDTFFENYFGLLRNAIDMHINSLSYKSFEDFFSKLLEYLSLDWPDFRQAFGDDIREIKATRNLLLHNNLVVNDQYIDTAGVKKRERPVVDKPYLQGMLQVLLGFEEGLNGRLLEKYKEYTKINASKRLWSFLFHAPVMPYDDFWQYDETTDRIVAFKQGRYENNLSHSELLMLSLWRAHFSITGGGEAMKGFNMRSFDTHNQEKVLFFLIVATDFSFY
jgi:hypothetical protein